jgi:phosphatidylserine/phosphatidylglycerophosphate/cardiolipin synthase-like enzyme
MQWSDLEQQLVNRGLLPSQARELIWEAVSSGSIVIIKSAPMVDNHLLDGEIRYEKILDLIRRTIGTGLIITMPASVTEENTSPTLVAFAQIIAAAKNNLYIISPYLDDVGVAKLCLPLQEAKNRGVRLMVISRETAKRQPSRTRGLRALSIIFGEQMDIRDYHTEAQGLSHYTSVHAKLIQADNQIGYVGSAELRGNALEKNFELGSILSAEHAELSLSAFKAVWEIAQRVKPQ